MASRNYLNATKLDDRIVRVDLDPGFEPGRQYGRGTTGGQVRDDRRREYDEGRGGMPPRKRQDFEKKAVAAGNLVGPTSGPLDTVNRQRHRYEHNMTLNKDGTVTADAEANAKADAEAKADVKADDEQADAKSNEQAVAAETKQSESEEKTVVVAETAVKEEDRAVVQEPPLKKQRVE